MDEVAENVPDGEVVGWPLGVFVSEGFGVAFVVAGVEAPESCCVRLDPEITR